MIIAIDGPAGTGKSTIAKMLAERFGAVYLNSGNLYRAIAMEALARGLSIDDGPGLEAAARAMKLSYVGGKLALEGSVIEDQLHTREIDAVVAQVSAHPELRLVVNGFLTSSARDMDAVVEGRDMTTVVFPDARFKFYLDASVEARTDRRFKQDPGRDRDEVRENIVKRDGIDTTKKVGKLEIAPGAVYLDTSDLTIDQVYDTLCRKILQQGTHMAARESETNANTTQEGSIQNSLQEEYLKGMQTLTEGELVDGHVIQVTNDCIFIDVGYKSEGKIPVAEFDVLPKVGDIVSVVLLKKETHSGDIVVSKKKADEKQFWKTISNAFKNHETIDGTIDKEIKGGFEVSLGHGVRAFLPASKADTQRFEDGAYLVGVKSKFYLERIYSEKKVNIVVNRRKYMEEESEQNRDRFFQTVQIGDTVKGIVKSFTSFGAFVDLGGFDGLLHINDMSWGHVARPKDFVKKGQEIELKVIRMDPEEKRINLSLKHFTEDPWTTFESRYHEGDIVKGTITKLTEYGAFIEIEEGIEGLAHISEFSWTRKVKKADEMVHPGDKVDCMILGYDLQTGKVSLGLKQVTSNPWDEVPQKYPVGMRLSRKIAKVTSAGAFVQLEDGIDGFLHNDDLAWTRKAEEEMPKLEVGQEIEVMVISCDPDGKNIRLGVKQLGDDPWKSFSQAYRIGSIVEGTVSSVTDFGVFVRVPGDMEGLISKFNLSDDKSEHFDDLLKKYQVGQQVSAVIVELNPDRQKLGLSVKDLTRKQQREEMSRFLHSEDNSEGFTLGDLLKGRDSEKKDV